MGWFRSAPSRDAQRQRVYKAERRFFGSPLAPKELSRRIEAVPDVQKYVDDLVRNPKFRARFTQTGITVHDGRGRRAAGGWVGNITLPSWARSVGVILHEVAHGLASNGHGGDFCRVFADLIEIVTDRHTAMLFEGTLRAFDCEIEAERPRKAVVIAACQRPKPLVVSHDGKTYHTHPDKLSARGGGEIIWNQVHSRTGVCRNC